MKFIKIIALSTFFLTLTNNLYGQTSIGNGGDTVGQFLMSTKEQIINVFQEMSYDIESRNNYLSFCNEVVLTPKQKSSCRDFIKHTHKQIFEILIAEDSPEFILEFEPIYIKEGNTRRPVSARTTFDKTAPIYFYYDSIKWLKPKYLMGLMIHEYIHKARYKGGYIYDKKTKMFKGFKSGRAIIDAVSTSITNFAANRGLVIDQYLIMDQFYCTIEDLLSPSFDRFGIIGSSPRNFNGPTTRPNYDDFNVGIGTGFRDMKIFIEKEESRIELKLETSLSMGCHEDSDIKTTIEILEVGLETKVLNALMLDKSPICHPGKAFEIESDQARFSCRYEGSFSQSSGFLEPN